jgi:hypothetical protein
MLGQLFQIKLVNSLVENRFRNIYKFSLEFGKVVIQIVNFAEKIVYQMFHIFFVKIWVIIVEVVFENSITFSKSIC